MKTCKRKRPSIMQGSLTKKVMLQKTWIVRTKLTERLIPRGLNSEKVRM